jgi:FHS family Na+ dependent glucose MFS transporter 1
LSTTRLGGEVVSSPLRVRPVATTLGYYAAFIGLGLISASLGPTLPGLAEQTGTDLGAISFLFTTRATGYLLGSLLGGRLYDRMAGHPLLAVSLLVMGAGMVAAPMLPLLWSLALVLLLIGVAEATLDVGGNTLIVWVHGAKVGPWMNALHFAYGVGAFIAPLVIAYAINTTGGIRWGYWLLAMYTVPTLIWLARLPSPHHESVKRTGDAAPVEVRWRLIGLIMLFMVLYVGAEVSVGGWLYTYAIALNLADATTAAYLTSVYWGALTLGRLAAIPIAARFRPRTILLVDLLGGVASVLLMLVVRDQPWAVWAGAFGAGLFFASVFPTVLVWAERRMTMTGLATSTFLVGASLGAMLLPWLIGQLFDRLGASVTMLAILIDLLLACGLFVALMAFGGPPRHETDLEQAHP